MTWHFGLSSGACPDRPILDALPALAESGAAGLEIGTPPRHFDPWQDWQVDALRDALARIRMPAISIHAPFGGVFDLADPNPRHRETALDAMLTSAHAIKRLGGRSIVVHPSDLERHHHPVEARLADCLDSLTSLAAACRQEDVTMFLESPLPHLIGGHPDEFAWLLSRLDESVKVCLDTGHLFLGRHWHRFVAVSGARLAHIHASDNHGTWDDHLAPGDGAVDWSEVFASLHRTAFAGWIMVELHCPGEDARHTFRRALAQTRALVGLYDGPGERA